MKIIKKYSLEQLKAVEPMLSEEEKRIAYGGEIHQGGYLYFTWEEMIEKYETEASFPAAFKSSIFLDTELSTSTSTHYERFWYISEDAYFSFINPEGGSSTVNPDGGEGGNNGGGNGEGVETLSEKQNNKAKEICSSVYSHICNRRDNVSSYPKFEEEKLPLIQTAIKECVKDANEDIGHTITLQADDLVECSIWGAKGSRVLHF